MNSTPEGVKALITSMATRSNEPAYLIEAVIRDLENRGFYISPAPAPVEAGRGQRQATVGAWCVAAFGEAHATSKPQRGLRLAEEAIEAAQASGTHPDQLHKLIDFVYSRPVGTLGQELGGIGVTLLALAHAAGLSAEDEEAREVARVLAKSPSHFHKRNEAKNAAGFDASAYPVASPPAGEGEA